MIIALIISFVLGTVTGVFVEALCLACREDQNDKD